MLASNFLMHVIHWENFSHHFLKIYSADPRLFNIVSSSQGTTCFSFPKIPKPIFSAQYQGFPQAVYTLGGGGGQVLGDKALMGRTHEGGDRPYGGGGDLTLIDYIIN